MNFGIKKYIGELKEERAERAKFRKEVREATTKVKREEYKKQAIINAKNQGKMLANRPSLGSSLARGAANFARPAKGKKKMKPLNVNKILFGN